MRIAEGCVLNTGLDDVQALASATRFKDFAGRGVPAFAATLAFVDVHLINVSGSEGESKKPKNFFIECKHVQVM